MQANVNDILEKNLMSLKKENQEIKEEILAQLEKEERKFSPEICVGTEWVENRKILYVIKEGKQYQLDSLYNGEELVDKWFSQLENINYRSRYLLFGFGNGMYVRKLLKSAGEESKIIVVEPSLKIFKKVMEEFDISDIFKDERVIILIPNVTEKRFIDALRATVQVEDITGAVCRSYLNYSILFPEQNKNFDDDIRLHLNSINANRTVIVRMGHAFYNNFFCNFEYFAKGKSLISLNTLLPKNIPAILVSSGPSLDKNIQMLKRAKNRAFILAADSAVKALIHHDIVPDAMICIDALKSHEHFKDPKIKKIPLIAKLISSRTAMIFHEGDKYFLHDDNPYIEEIFKKFEKVLPEVCSGGSVATDGFALLERLQFETIILVGQDLAYTNKKTHSINTIRGKENRDISEELLIQVEDINGNMIDTSYEFQIYLDWFIEEIGNNHKVNVIDATEGGARIPGTKIMTLEDSINQYCNQYVNIDEVMQKVSYRLTKEEQIQFINYINEIPQKLEKIKIMVDEVYFNYQKMWSFIQQNTYNVSYLKKMLAKVSKRIDEIEKSVAFYFIELTLQPALEEILDEDLFSKKESETELETSIKQALKYFEAMKKEADISALAAKWSIENYGNEKIRREIYFGKEDEK